MPAAQSWGNLRSQLPRLLILAPNGPETMLVVAFLVPQLSCQRAPVWGPLPASAPRVWTQRKGQDTLGCSATPFPGALFWNPQKGQGRGGIRHQGPPGRTGRDAAPRERLGRGRSGESPLIRGEGGRPGSRLPGRGGDARQGGSLPATATATRPRSSSRSEGSTARSMTPGAGAERRVSEVRGGAPPPTQRTAGGAGGAGGAEAKLVHWLRDPGGALPAATALYLSVTF